MPKTERKTNRAPQGAGGICKRSDGRWQGSCTIGTNPGTGKPMKKYVYASTEKECVKKLKALQSAIENGTFIEPNRMTVGRWMDIWATEYLLGVKPNTAYEYRAHIKNHITPALGAVKLQKLNPHQVQAFYNDLQRTNGLSPKTIKNLHGVLHKALKQALLLGYVRLNPADNVTLPRIEKTEVQTLPDDALPQFLQAIEGHPFASVYFVTLFTGLRKGEVLGLTWDCINFERGTVLINKQLQLDRGTRKGYALMSTKNDKPRRITPARTVMQRLWQERVRQTECGLKAGELWSNPQGMVFTNEFGRHLSPDTVYKHFKSIVTSIGYPDIPFHGLRHTYAVNALQAGDNVKVVQGNLGHHTAAFTLDVYGHVTDKMQQDSAERMERLIQTVAK